MASSISHTVCEEKDEEAVCPQLTPRVDSIVDPSAIFSGMQPLTFFVMQCNKMYAFHNEIIKTRLSRIKIPLNGLHVHVKQTYFKGLYL